MCTLGALAALKRQGFLDRVQRYSGTSVGSLLAAGLALGRSPDRMLAAALRHPLQPDVAPRRFGVDGGRGLGAFIRKVLGLRRKVTLGDVPALRVCVYNATKRRPEYWSHENHPDMSLVFAVRVSCTVPFVFGAVRFRGELYVDGAVADPTPVRDPANTLAIEFSARNDVDTIEGFAAALRYLPETKARWLLRLDTDLNPLDFNAPLHILQNAFRTGQEQAVLFAKKHV